MREQLLGYLLGALDCSEHEEVEHRLAVDREWQRELESLQGCLQPLEATRQETEPPPGLAERTCATVAEHVEARLVTPASARLPAATSPSPATARWSVADAIVATGICLAAALLFFPAISNSRYVARLLACENNLREIGIALADYSDKAGAGHFPAVSSHGNRAFAGVYAPTLFDGGYLDRPEATLCPASVWVGRSEPYVLPTLTEIDLATGYELIALQKTAGGSFGYNLGVVQDGRHVAPRNQGRTFFAIMSDAPTFNLGKSLSANHGGRSYNMLFEDGHVRQVSRQRIVVREDDPFRNRRGAIEAGLDEDDAVIGCSVTPPFQRLLLDRQFPLR
jgi:prepilin-type processing-associated H-X9-DG protein